MATVILRLPEVMARTGKRKTAIYEAMGRGEFPQNIDLGGNLGGGRPRSSVGWIEAEVEEWIQQRVALSRKAA